MLKVLREPRWIALIVAVPIGVVLCLMLSDWQWNRYEGRKEANVVLGQNIDKPPVQASQLLASATAVDDSTHWRSVEATGTYDVDAQVLVRRKPLSGTNGFWVATPLVTKTGDVLVVNRGWVKAGSNAQVTPSVPAPPTGEVTVIGRVQPSSAEAARPTDMPVGQVQALNVASVGAESGTRILPAYIDLSSSNPPQAPGLVLIPVPQIDEGPHLSYSLQWIAFAILFIVGIFLLLRREVRLRREEAALAAGESATRQGESTKLPQDSHPG